MKVKMYIDPDGYIYQADEDGQSIQFRDSVMNLSWMCSHLLTDKVRKEARPAQEVLDEEAALQGWQPWEKPEAQAVEAKSNAVKLAEAVLSAVKHFKGELTAEGCRQALGKSYNSYSGLESGGYQCSPRGVKLIPKDEDFMDLTWSKFIKFCRESGLMEEESTPCNPKPAPSTAAAATTAAPAAVSPAATSTTLESAEDAAASTPESSTESTQASPSAPCSPVGSDTAVPLACAPSASATPAAGFDYGGLDQPTVDTLHLAEKMIADARRDYVAKLAQAVYIAHDALLPVSNCDGQTLKHNQHSEKTFVQWCASVGLSKGGAYRLLQVAGLLNGATPEEQAVLEAASPSLLYAAAKPSAPAQLVQGVKDGDITTNKQYQELLAQLKAKDQALADEKAAHKAESLAFSEALADEQRLRQASDAARIEAESTVRGLQELCSGASKSEQAAIQRAEKAEQQLATTRDELRQQTGRVKELEARPIEVKGADPDDIARWRAEGAKPVQAQLDKVQAEADDLREKLREAEAGKDSTADELAISKQIVNTVEGILRARFGVLDAMPYEVFEAAVEPFEALRDRLSEALEVGRWPSGKEND